MSDAAPPPYSVVIVAGGTGTRAGLNRPKQFAVWRGQPLVRHAVSAFHAHGAAEIVVVVPADGEDEARAALAGLPVVLAQGGATRQDSVAAGLERLAPCTAVLIHDAARPSVPARVIDSLLGALNDSEGAIPVLPVVDSLAVADGSRMAGSAPREALRRVQTPQAFRYAAILAAHRGWSGARDAGDDAQVLAAAGGTIALVEGDEALRKLTFSTDFASMTPMVRTGLGYDVHRLVEGEELWLCGVRIPHARGLSGHSDADVALHALTDALLGAIGDGDIGTHFPPSDPQWKGASSDRFLAHAAALVRQAGFIIANVDVTLVCEAPRIGPHRPAMRARVAQLLGVEEGRVSIKATTTERLGFTGREEGIAAQALATLQSEA